MSETQLRRAKVGPVGEQLNGKCIAKAMRTHVHITAPPEAFQIPLQGSLGGGMAAPAGGEESPRQKIQGGDHMWR